MCRTTHNGLTMRPQLGPQPHTARAKHMPCHQAARSDHGTIFLELYSAGGASEASLVPEMAAAWCVSLYARFRIPVDTDWNSTQIEAALTQEVRKARNQAQDAAAIVNTNYSQAWLSQLERATSMLARAMCNGPCPPPSNRFSMREPTGCLGTHSTRRLQRLAWLACNLHPPDCVVLSIGISSLGVRAARFGAGMRGARVRPDARAARSACPNGAPYPARVP